MRRLGVHTSIAGGLDKSLVRAKELGCDTLQIFSHNPRGWALSDVAPDEAAAFRKTREKLGLDPVFIHSCYLINLASQYLEIRERSLWMLGQELARADVIGADYVILHLAQSAGEDGIESLIMQIRSVIGRKGKKRFRAGLLFENTAGLPGKAGGPKDTGAAASSLSALAQIVEECGIAGICFDTCHGFASGYDIREPGQADAIAEEVSSRLGQGKIKLIHLNDSKGALGSGLDRHEHLGKGKIGSAGLRRFLASAGFAEVPVVLETPKEAESDDLMNLKAARSLIIPD
ncbi:MAG: deoxyribonuclease IV [Actinomycetota bacterium]|nr:deoxyribonuclease IV [Actinomycetota bacterium]